MTLMSRAHLPVGYSLDTKRCCDERITAAFFNTHAVTFRHRGERIRVRFRKLFNEGAETSLLIARLEAHGVQFEVLSSEELRFWTNVRHFQLRYTFSARRHLSSCCSELVLRRCKRNQWTPSLND